MPDISPLSNANALADAAEPGFWAAIGAAIMGFLVLVGRLYRTYKTAQALERGHAHVTDETIRKQLWTQWGYAVERVKELEIEVRKLAVENRQLKDMNRNCAQENGVLVAQLSEQQAKVEGLEKRVKELEDA